MTMPITLRAQVEETRAVFAGRERAIKFEAAKGQMRQAVADLHIARMQAALRSMEWLLRNEATIKAKVDAAGEPS